jgi:hypothetical protein
MPAVPAAWSVTTIAFMISSCVPLWRHRALRLELCLLGRNALPAVAAQLPIIGVAAGTFGTVGLLVAETGVDDREVAESADQHLMRTATAMS